MTEVSFINLKCLTWKLVLEIFLSNFLQFCACRACRVCRLWREATIHSSLWQHLDLANGRIRCTDATLDWLSENRLSQVKSLNLGGWKKLTDEGVKVISVEANMLVTLLFCLTFLYTSWKEYTFGKALYYTHTGGVYLGEFLRLCILCFVCIMRSI